MSDSGDKLFNYHISQQIEDNKELLGWGQKEVLDSESMNTLFSNQTNGGIDDTNDLNQFFDGYHGVNVVLNVDHEEIVEVGDQEINEENVQVVVEQVVEPRRRGRPAIKDPVLKKKIRNARERIASQKYRLNKKLKLNAFELQMAKQINKNMDLLSDVSALHIQYNLIWSLCLPFAHLMSGSNKKNLKRSRKAVDLLLKGAKK